MPALLGISFFSVYQYQKDNTVYRLMAKNETGVSDLEFCTKNFLLSIDPPPRWWAIAKLGLFIFRRFSQLDGMLIELLHGHFPEEIKPMGSS